MGPKRFFPLLFFKYWSNVHNYSKLEKVLFRLLKGHRDYLFLMNGPDQTGQPLFPIGASAYISYNWDQHFRFLSTSRDGRIDGNLGTRMIRIFHCATKSFALGPCVGLDPQRQNFALGIQTCWYLKTLKFALPRTPNLKFGLPHNANSRHESVLGFCPLSKQSRTLFLHASNLVLAIVSGRTISGLWAQPTSFRAISTAEPPPLPAHSGGMECHSMWKVLSPHNMAQELSVSDKFSSESTIFEKITLQSALMADKI